MAHELSLLPFIGHQNIGLQFAFELYTPGILQKVSIQADHELNRKRIGCVTAWMPFWPRIFPDQSGVTAHSTSAMNHHLVNAPRITFDRALHSGLVEKFQFHLCRSSSSNPILAKHSEGGSFEVDIVGIPPFARNWENLARLRAGTTIRT